MTATRASAKKDPLWTPISAAQLSAARQAPSAEEVARRTKIIKRILKLRDSLPPIDIDPSEFLRQERQEADAS